MRRPLRPLAALGVLAVLLPVTIALGDGGEELVACQSVDAKGAKQVSQGPGRWLRIAAPKFDAGEGQRAITGFTTTPYKSNGIFVTNGTVVRMSADAGCTWVTVYKGGGIKAPAPGYVPDHIDAITAPSDFSLWMATHDDAGGVPHPHVYVGDNIGTGKGAPIFTALDTGLPSYGQPVSPSAGSPPARDAFVLMDELPDPASGEVSRATRHLYTTYRPEAPAQADAAGALVGTAWKEVVPPSGFGRIEGFVMQGSHTVWIWGGTKVARATAADTSAVAWTVTDARGVVQTLDVSHGVVTVVVSSPQGTTVRTATPNGSLEPAGIVPVEPTAFAHGDTEGVFVASGKTGTWGYDHRLSRWIDITPRGIGAFDHLEMTNGTAARLVLGLRDNALYRWDTYVGETFVRPPPLPSGVGDPNHVTLPTSKLRGPVLNPTAQVVTIAPGQAHEIPVTFRVPPAPSPLDVYFLVDVTESMDSAIQSLQLATKTLAADLNARLGASACFGVGMINDVGTQPAQTNATSTLATADVFKTILRVDACDKSPGLQQVNAAIDQLKLQETWGGDIPEAHTVALTQAITGAGQAYVPVPAGQEAGFHPGAFKVIVMMSDADSHEGGGYPTVGESIRTLNSADVKVVNILLPRGDHHDLAKRMMTTIARGTNSLAPPSGVDCNGDGGGQYGDLGPGAPLVCDVPRITRGKTVSINVGPAVLGLLVAVKDPGTVAVAVTDPDGVVRRPIRGLTSAVTNLKFESGLAFTMSVACTKAQDGKDLPVDLLPTVRSLPVGLSGRITVRCRAPKPLLLVPPIVPRPEQPARPRPPVPRAAPGLPAPVNPPAQPISNINPNAGFSQQEESQPQLAAVTQDVTETQQEATAELEMSSLRDERRKETGAALAGAFVLSVLAVGYQRRLQRRTRFSHVRAS